MMLKYFKIEWVQKGHGFFSSKVLKNEIVPILNKQTNERFTGI